MASIYELNARGRRELQNDINNADVETEDGDGKKDGCLNKKEFANGMADALDGIHIIAL